MAACSYFSFNQIWILSCVLLLVIPTLTADSCFIQTVDTDGQQQLSDIPDSVNIVEFDLIFSNYSSGFWKNVSGSYWYKPTRLYRCVSQISERFLLLFQYYYGLFKPYAYVGLSQWRVTVVTNPPVCLREKNRQEIQTILNNFILSGLLRSNGSNKVDDSARSVCSMRIIDRSGWAYFGYRCCRVSSDGDLNCYLVTEDTWTWILRILILTATVIIFLYFPILIPKSFRMEVFSFAPQTTQTLNILKTENPRKAVRSPQTITIPFKRLQRMREFSKLITEIPPDAIHTFHIKKLDLCIKFDKIVAQNEPPFGLFRALFDTFIRCQIGHTDALDDCCNTRICGHCSCRACPRWYVVVRALRTVLIFTVLALPSVPLLYHLCQPNQEYREMVQMADDLALKQTSSFSFHATAGLAVVCVVMVMYVSHIIVVVVDEIRDQNLGKLYGQLLSSQNARSTLKRSKNKVRSVIKNGVYPLQKLGILFLPIWMIFLLISPVIMFLYFIVTSPVFRIGLRILRLILGSFENNKRGREELEKRFENLAFCLTIIGVFVVLTIGCNFLLHVLTMAIINMIVNIRFTMRILPVVILIAFYIRDTFSNVASVYYSYSKTLLGLVLSERSEECRQVARQSVDEQDNVVFQCGPLNTVPASSNSPMFLTDEDQLLMNTRGLVLFLHKEDMPYLSRQFFNQATDISCHGSPGPVSESLRSALFEFARIIFFLACLLIVVMAYGDISYISPEGQFFATFVTGLIPFALKKFFLKQDGGSSLDTGNLRFVTQFDDLKKSFQQTWPLDDILPVSEEERAKPFVESVNGRSASTSTWSMDAILPIKHKSEVLHLIVDMSDTRVPGQEREELKEHVSGTRVPDQDGKELKELSNGRKLPCLRPISVSP